MNQCNQVDLVTDSSIYQNLDDNEGKNEVLLHKADQHMRQGRLFYRRKEYQKAVMEFKTSLKLRESFIGRYDTFTAGVYYFIGNSYFQIGDYDKALVAYRTRLRIRRRLSDDPTAPAMDNRIISSLEKKGFTREQIDAYDANLNESLEHEMQGDEFREKRDYKKAILKYKRAVAVEKESIGKEVTVAFLWRKIAYLVDHMDDMSYGRASINWQQADCISEDGRSDDGMDNETVLSVATKASVRTYGTASTGSSLGLDDLELHDEEGIRVKDQADCVFGALHRLAVGNEHAVDWKKVEACADVDARKSDMRRTQRLGRLSVKRKSIIALASASTANLALSNGIVFATPVHQKPPLVPPSSRTLTKESLLENKTKKKAKKSADTRKKDISDPTTTKKKKTKKMRTDKMSKKQRKENECNPEDSPSKGRVGTKVIKTENCILIPTTPTEQAGKMKNGSPTPKTSTEEPGVMHHSKPMRVGTVVTKTANGILIKSVPANKERSQEADKKAESSEPTTKQKKDKRKSKGCKNTPKAKVSKKDKSKTKQGKVTLETKCDEVSKHRVTTEVTQTENGIIVQSIPVVEEPKGWNTVFDDCNGAIKV